MRGLSLILVLANAGPVAAETPTVSTDIELEYLLAPGGSGSANETSLSVVVEVEKAGIYGGLAVKAVNDKTLNELALSFGYRGAMAGGLGFDLGYTRYAYPNDSAADFGEVVLGLEKGFGAAVTATFELGYDPQAQLANAYLEVAYSASDKFDLSTNCGVYEVDAAPSESEWDFGVTYAVSEEAGVDLRYYDGTEYADAYVGLAFTWEPSF